MPEELRGHVEHGEGCMAHLCSPLVSRVEAILLLNFLCMMMQWASVSYMV